MTLLTPDQAAVQLTQQFAAEGLGPEDIRVSRDPLSLGSTLDVTILRLGIRVEVVDRIVAEHLEPVFDRRGELMLGWNRHVDVRYSRHALAPLVADAFERIRGLRVGESRTVGSCIVTRAEGLHSWEVELEFNEDYIPRAFPTARAAARLVAQFAAAAGRKAIP
jgi:hypothetical protein